MTYTYSLKTHNREEMIDITSYIQESVESSKIEEGILIVYVPHTTAASLKVKNILILKATLTRI